MNSKLIESIVMIVFGAVMLLTTIFTTPFELGMCILSSGLLLAGILFLVEVILEENDKKKSQTK